MKSQELIEGKVYFFCMFSNAQHPIPEVTPYVYTGFDDGVYHFRTPERHIISGALRQIPDVDEAELNDYCNSDDMAVASEEDLEFFVHSNKCRSSSLILSSMRNSGYGTEYLI